MDDEIIQSWCFHDVECFDSTPSAAIIILDKDLESSSSLRSQQRSDVQSFGSQPVGDGTSSNALKEMDKMRSLIESVSRSDRKIMLELWFEYPGQLVITTRG